MFDFNHYHNICAATAADDGLFRNFRQEQTFYDMYEHVTYEHGLVYLEQINKTFPEVMQHIELFARNDNVGNPVRKYYEELGFHIAPTTLRYVKILADLVNQFGSLDGMNIVEVGGGYGGQCKIIHDMFTPKSYTLIDLPEAIRLAQRYLFEFGIVIDGKSGPYDLFISNYAFTEIERGYQDIYTENFIKKSERGYMTCNFYEWHEAGNMTFSDIINLMPDSKVMEEIPLTANDNFIYIWDRR